MEEMNQLAADGLAGKSTFFTEDELSEMPLDEVKKKAQTKMSLVKRFTTKKPLDSKDNLEVWIVSI